LQVGILIQVQNHVFFQLSMLHAVSHHYIHSYPGGLEALEADQPLFMHNDGWINHGSEELKLQFDVKTEIALN
jgi:hypothetical protein